jgi:hypothetical protein
MNITDVVSWTTPVPLIDDGDPLSNAEFLATAQALANRTAWLREGMPGKAVAVESDVPIAAPVATTNFISVNSASHFYYQQDSVSGAGNLYFLVSNLPKFGKIDVVKVFCAGSGHSSLPATKPMWELYRTPRAVGSAYPQSATQVSTATDTSGNVATYDASHDIQATGINHTILTDNDYLLKFFGETGANSQIGLNVFAVVIGLAG